MYRAKAQGSGGHRRVPHRDDAADPRRPRAGPATRHRRRRHRRRTTSRSSTSRLGRWIGVEALARWRHPRHGWMLAEHVHPARRGDGPDQRARRARAHARRCARARRGIDDGVDRPATSAINVSGRQLAEPPVPRPRSSDTWQLSGLAPVAAAHRAHRDGDDGGLRHRAGVIARLLQLGVRLVIDDFGTGHSTLARLRHFPASALKLDRSFVVELGQDPASERVVAAVVQLAHAVDLRGRRRGRRDRRAAAGAATGSASTAPRASCSAAPMPPEEAVAVLRGPGRRAPPRRPAHRRHDSAGGGPVRGRANRPSPPLTGSTGVGERGRRRRRGGTDRGRRCRRRRGPA